MKYFWLVCEAMADEPIEALGGRTPMDVAKTPFMDELAKKAKLGNAAWLPTTLSASGDVAAYSMLGYDPVEYHTGLAPLEALAAGIAQNDSQVAFRCDFVTVSDQELVDPTAGLISFKEAELLIRELNKKLSDFKSRIVGLSGHRNLLFVDDPQNAEALDELECSAPERFRGENISKGFPKGKESDFLKQLMTSSRTILENHEVNRVRIDLKENPASMIWLWGQGRKPKIPAFSQRSGLKTAFWAQSDAWKGLLLAAGLQPQTEWKAAAFSDFNFAQSSVETHGTAENFKAKVRRIEAFDAKVVGVVVKQLKKTNEPARVLITSDTVRSSEKNSNTHAHAPVLWWETGVEPPGAADSFTEKNCGQAGTQFDPGYKTLDAFLKA